MSPSKAEMACRLPWSWYVNSATSETVAVEFEVVIHSTLAEKFFLMSSEKDWLYPALGGYMAVMPHDDILTWAEMSVLCTPDMGDCTMNKWYDQGGGVLIIRWEGCTF